MSTTNNEIKYSRGQIVTCAPNKCSSINLDQCAECQHKQYWQHKSSVNNKYSRGQIVPTRSKQDTCAPTKMLHV